MKRTKDPRTITVGACVTAVLGAAGLFTPASDATEWMQYCSLLFSVLALILGAFAKKQGAENYIPGQSSFILGLVMTAWNLFRITIPLLAVAMADSLMKKGA